MVTVDASKEKKIESTEIKSEDIPSPPPISYDSLQIILSMFVAAVIGLAIYNIPSYWLYEHLTRDLVLEIIRLFGVNAIKSVSTENPSAPAIQIIFDKTHVGNYGIVRACTGMQAGAILVALILVTDAPLKNKSIAVPSLLLILFTANVLRVAFHML
ncbi:MAG: hypothetical protein ACFFDT_23945, partial [Candidatus Hodarchaeota archaeon]